ncbi:DUF6188 family protein [Hymenobacter puniceus]|uniref:DUF6188 family protein n=1 Tax=Hymenobacter sp. BT190 TaxID=2763505 RepID=UPI0016510DD0|nr:DUF6188 family protein [Hymenobacter sp. BT190]MBC6698777.1 hypothetical protein [Hymenobacter sp. BT190]
MSETRKHVVSFAEFKQVIEKLQHQPAWRSRAGNETGSIFTLQFGLLSSTDETQGEFSLMVWCAWRIVKAEHIICTWHEDAGTNLAPALQTLESSTVASATFTAWGDLTIDFSNGYSLHIWNDAPFKDFDSWSIGYSGLGYYSVATRNTFFYEPDVD